MKRLIQCMCIVLAMSTYSVASADPVKWNQNSHYYALVNFIGGTWQQAEADALSKTWAGMQGHLVTITSVEENTFLRDKFAPFNTTLIAWIGAYQSSNTSEPSGNWKWVTGETWGYTNWEATQPDNSQTGEDFAAIVLAGPMAAWGQSQNGEWFDNVNGFNAGYYIVEFDEYKASPDPEPVSVTLDVDIKMRWPVDANMNAIQDPTKIAGYCSQSDVLYQGTKLGNMSMCTMLNGPYDPTELFTETTLRGGTLVVPGVGRCQIDGQAISMNIDEAGNFAIRYIGKLTECTGQLQGLEGLVDGQGTDNLYDPAFSQDDYNMNIYLKILQ